jgi:hypothetical protein
MRRRPPGRASAARNIDFARRIAAAAGPVLAALGCRQKGRAPMWIADQRFWVVLVDLQPGILTVGASFLWWVQSQWSFDHGRRFADVGDEEQMAHRAAEEVTALRAEFPSIAAIARVLVDRAGDRHWPLYHAAVASGLAGDSDTAARLFQRLLEKPVTREWEAELSSTSRALAQSLGEPAAFRRAVTELINKMRALQGLPRDSDCFGGGS